MHNPIIPHSDGDANLDYDTAIMAEAFLRFSAYPRVGSGPAAHDPPTS